MSKGRGIKATEGVEPVRAVRDVSWGVVTNNPSTLTELFIALSIRMRVTALDLKKDNLPLFGDKRDWIPASMHALRKRWRDAYDTAIEAERERRAALPLSGLCKNGIAFVKRCS